MSVNTSTEDKLAFKLFTFPAIISYTHNIQASLYYNEVIITRRALANNCFNTIILALELCNYLLYA